MTPCQLNPELWFDETHLGRGLAIHQCLDHCRDLAKCRSLKPVERAVVAGVAYGFKATPLRGNRRPLPVPCEACRVGRAA